MDGGPKLQRKNSMEKVKLVKVDPLSKAFCIVSHNLEWKKRWDILICVFVLYNSFSIPYELAFTIGESEVIGGINWAVDSLFLIDIFVGFRTSFIDKDGKEVICGWKIASHYLHTSFLIDIIATVPIDLIAREAFRNSDPRLQLFGIFKMGRLARLERIIRMLTSTQTVKVVAQLCYMMISILIYLHWYCCIYWLIVKNDAVWLPNYLMHDQARSLRFLYQDKRVG